MTEPLLRVENVSTSRNGTTILDSVSFEVDSDERVLVQGVSGSGKTTLFSMVGLLATPDEGRIVIDGTDVTDRSERERARLRRTVLGYVYQDFKLVPDLTARENALLPQDHLGERDEVWIDELFDRLSIGHVADRRPAELSGGEKQRVATARALANRPSLVLADEPTGHLDPDTADHLIELLCSLQREFDTSLVVVSHDRSFVDRFPRVLRLENGTLEELDAQPRSESS